jgi:hypothetical protein
MSGKEAVEKGPQSIAGVGEKEIQSGERDKRAAGKMGGLTALHAGLQQVGMPGSENQ